MYTSDLESSRRTNGYDFHCVRYGIEINFSKIKEIDLRQAFTTIMTKIIIRSN